LYGYWRNVAETIEQCHTFARLVIDTKASDF
jgi:hypothetical protein